MIETTEAMNLTERENVENVQEKTNDMTLKYSNIVGCSSLYEKKKQIESYIKHMATQKRKQVALTIFN